MLNMWLGEQLLRNTALQLHVALFRVIRTHLKNSSFPFLAALGRKQIDLSSMLGVYFVLIAGTFLAFFALCAEIYWKRRVDGRKISNFLRLINYVQI